MINRYSHEEVQQLLGLASTLQQKGFIPRSQLQDIAAEVGISLDEFQQAERLWQQQRQTAQELERRRSRRQFGFQMHLIPYIFTSVLLVLLNVATTPRCFWSLYPTLGWGLGVTIHAACVYRKEEKLENMFVA
jgi:hypothetical protein